jgi:hypothetical protein
MLEIRHRFPAHAASAGAARRAVEGLLAGSSPGNLDNARIIVSELVTYSILNSTRDYTGWIDLALKVSRTSLRIELRNGGSAPDAGVAPASKEDALSETSRSIVEHLADDWGTSPAHGIWAVLSWGPSESGSKESDALRSISDRLLSSSALTNT